MPLSVSRSWASATCARTSATPDITAQIVAKSAPTASASRRARLVLPVPGGPHRRSDARWPRATPRRSGPRLADEVLLADELLERARSHPRGERLALGRWLEQGFGAGAADGADGCGAWGHGRPRLGLSRRSVKTLSTSIRIQSTNRIASSRRRDPDDVLHVARDVGVLVASWAANEPAASGADSSRVATRSFVRLRASSAARSSASIAASSSAARATRRRTGRWAWGSRARGGGRRRGDEAGRRSTARRWPGRTLPRARFAMGGIGPPGSRGRAAAAPLVSVGGWKDTPAHRVAAGPSGAPRGECREVPAAILGRAPAPPEDRASVDDLNRLVTRSIGAIVVVLAVACVVLLGLVLVALAAHVRGSTAGSPR